MNTDLIIIGSGPGGYRAAAYAASKGLSVAIIERGYLGGTCLNEGCIPTKTYARNAEIMETMSKAGSLGMDNLTYDFNFAKVLERKEGVLAKLRQGIEAVLSAPGITLVNGDASFVDAHTVSVDGETYTAKNIMIATGSSSKGLPFADIDEGATVTSGDILSIDTLPKRLCIVGAGVIGMEFASIFSTFGVEVTVVEFLKECLPALDSDIAKRLRKSIEKRGVKFYLQSAVKSVKISGDVRTVEFERKGKAASVEADMVLMAVGRKPNTEGLNLEAAGVEYSNKGIAVNDNMQTNIEGIYAIGDVNARQMLAHAATMQGIHAVNHIVGEADSIDMGIMPAAIFTNPEAASVGMSEDACKDAGTEYICKRKMYTSNGKALAMDETEGLIKLITDGDGQIIGCHAFGAHAADMVQEVSVLMCSHASLPQLRDMVHIHPTLGEMLQDAAF